MNSQKSSHTSRVNNSVRLQALWTVAWVLSSAISAFGPKFLWNQSVPISIIAIVITVLVGFGMIWANVKYLQTIDELQRKLHLDSMAIALGVGIVVGLGYSQLDISNVISFDAEIGHLVMLIGVTYLAVLLRGVKRMS